jgi:hypothetical protein
MSKRLLTFILSLGSATLALAQQYTVVYTDGHSEHGDSLVNSYEWSSSTNTPSIHTTTNIPLHRADARIRTIREAHHNAHLYGPYILLANGDVLPAIPTAILPVVRSAATTTNWSSGWIGLLRLSLALMMNHKYFRARLHSETNKPSRLNLLAGPTMDSKYWRGAALNALP